MRLREIMSTKVQTVRPDETLERARGLMRLRNIHHLVVREGRRVTGILSEASLERGEVEGVEKVENAMLRHVMTATPDMTIRQAANLMRGRAESALPVMAGGDLVGIVTVSDLLGVLGRGVDRSVPRERWTLRHRGMRPKTT